MQHHRTRNAKPAHHHPADRPHIDQWKRVQHDFTILQLRGDVCGGRNAYPMIMAAWYTLGDTGCPRCPTNGENIIGINFCRRTMGTKQFRPCRLGIQINGVAGCIRTYGHQLYVAALQQGANRPDMVGTFHLRTTDESLGLDDAKHRRKLMCAILDCNRANDCPDRSRGKVKGHKFGHVGQLDDNNIILTDACCKQCPGKTLHLFPHLSIGQSPWCTKGKVGAVRRIDERQPLRVFCSIGEKQIGKCLVSPPSRFAKVAPFFLSRDNHFRLLIQCLVPCRCHRHWPRPNVCPNKSARAE